MSFKDEIREALARAEMPQIKQKDLPAVYELLTKEGIQCEAGKITCDKLKPVQDGINREKIDHMKAEIQSGKDMGYIVVSEEGYIVDGHHRWIATQEACGAKEKINAVKVGLRKDEAVKVIKAMDSMNEGKAKVPMTLWITYGIPGEFERPIVYDVFEDKRDAERAAKRQELKVTSVDVSLPR